MAPGLYPGVFGAGSPRQVPERLQQAVGDDFVHPVGYGCYTDRSIASSNAA